MRERAAVPRATLRERAHGVWRAAERFGVELRNTAAVPIGRVLLSPAELWGSGSVRARARARAGARSVSASALPHYRALPAHPFAPARR